MKYVIYGASNMGNTAVQIMKLLKIDFDFFIDGDTKKHENYFHGKKIISPESFVNIKNDYTVIIASEFYTEILENLIRLNVKKEKIIKLYEFIVSNIDKIKLDLEQPKLINSRKSKIIFDCLVGLGIGGVQSWTFFLGKEFCERKKELGIITQWEEKDYKEVPGELHKYIKKFENNSIEDIANYIVNQLPCTVFSRYVEPVYMAARIVQMKYPDEIKIISVVHSGCEFAYEANSLIKDKVDNIFCVSQDIKNIMINKYGCDKNKVLYKESPILFDDKLIKKYVDYGEPIRIGYAARIEKNPKRADLLPKFVDELEKLDVNYVFGIAGLGSYFDILKAEIDKRNLGNKVKLLGWIGHEDMYKFFKNIDIFINISDYEGVGLSMLEAMSCGAVPIETEVCGAREFIEDSVNGYVSPIGNIRCIAESVKLLDDNRENIRKFGEKSRDIIRVKCNKEDYINYLLNIIK